MHNSISADHVLKSLALTVARNDVGAMRPVHELLASEGLTQSEYDEIAKNPQFRRYVDAYANDLRDNGYSFAAKSKVLAEDLLPTAYHMARDPETPAAVRAKILENLVEWADLKPKRTAEVSGGPSYGISIVINGTTATAISTKHVKEAQDVQEKAQATLTLPAAAPKTPSAIVFDEPDSYEYAGEDIYI